MHAGWLVEILPPIVGVAAGRASTSARRWTIVWCLVLALQDAVLLVTAVRGETNLFLSYLFLPVSGAVALWTLARWQTAVTARRTVRFGIPAFVLVSVLLSLVADNPKSFSQFTAPYYALVLLVAATWTFVRRSLASEGSLPGQDWFWVLGGLMVYFGASMAIQPLTSYLYGAGRNDLLAAAFDLRAVMYILAFLAITGGLLCPVPPTFSGGSSSSPSSPSGSSSLPSARRW
jgi:hypothetical protein